MMNEGILKGFAHAKDLAEAAKLQSFALGI
jgi:hypothetical protein